MISIFFIERSKICNRYDPSFYIRSSKLTNVIPLYRLVEVLGGKRIPQGSTYAGTPTDYLYLRVADISDDFNLDYKNLKFIDSNVYNKLRRYEIFNDDLALSIAGTIGKVVYIQAIPNNKHVILTENCAKLIIKRRKEVLPLYLKIVLELDVVQQQIQDNYIQTTIPKLSLERIKHLSIPVLPSIEKQQRIIDLYVNTYNEKQQKEQQAEALLNSIDDYLLGELGIELPETKPQTLQDRIFTVSISEVRDGRFDPKLYSIPVKRLKQSLYMSPFDKQPLKYFIKNNCSGEWGKDESEEVDENKYTKCLVIRATEFDNTYNLRLDNSRVKYRWIENSKLSRMNIQPNDLFIEKSGGSEDQPVGRISILADEILKDNQIAYSNFIHKITVEGINPTYLYFYLRTMYNIKITDSMQSQTNGIRNLIMSEYFDQTIVIPPISKQQKIVSHITEMRQQAKALQEEGKAILERAKRDIEQMIIG